MLNEIGVESVPVLARLGENFIDVEHMERQYLPAHGGYFNHMVLAIRAPAGTGAAARLTTGAGTGWVLFDPTDSLATFGLPPRKLEGTPAVWLTQDASVFKVELEGRSNVSRVDLEITLDPQQPSNAATFSARVSGASPYIDSASNHQLEGQVIANRQKSLQRTLRAFMPGAELSAVQFVEPNSASAAPVSVLLEGRLDAPLQQLTGDLHSFAAPMLLVQHTLGLSSKKIKVEAPRALTGEAAAFYAPLCCASFAAEMTMNIKFNLPAGWTIHKSPRLKTIDQPWLAADASLNESQFSATTKFVAGEFQTGNPENAALRVKDLNRLRKFWRGKFILRKEG
jgi:hypothetical protein